MQSYDPPPETDCLTAAQARKAVNQFRAAVLADRQHPFNDGNHSQHEDFSDYFRRLNLIVAQDEADQQDALKAEKLADALGEDMYLSSAEMQVKARELMKTPGYIEGRLPEVEREKLTRKIHALHRASAETSTPADQEETA